MRTIGPRKENSSEFRRSSISIRFSTVLGYGLEFQLQADLDARSSVKSLFDGSPGERPFREGQKAVLQPFDQPGRDHIGEIVESQFESKCALDMFDSREPSLWCESG